MSKINNLANKIVEHMQPTEKQKFMYNQVSSVKIIILLMLFSNMVYQLSATLTGSKPGIILLLYWSMWTVMIILSIVDQYKKQAIIVRAIVHILVIRNILPLYELK